MSRIAARAELPKTTTHRLVGELVAASVLEGDAVRGFTVGLQMWKFGILAGVHASLQDTAHPHLEDLHRATGENVQLAILDGDAALLVEHIHGSKSASTVSGMGRRIPLHATAVGKILAAHSQEATELLMQSSLRSYTPSTIADHRRLRASFARVRSAGVAYVYDELTQGATSVAVPIEDQAGGIRAAISLVLESCGVSPYRPTAALRTAAFGIDHQLPPQ